jgi:hypothetical protein
MSSLLVSTRDDTLISAERQPGSAFASSALNCLVSLHKQPQDGIFVGLTDHIPELASNCAPVRGASNLVVADRSMNVRARRVLNEQQLNHIIDDSV